MSDILADPFLSEHAPQQQAVLKLSQPAPFTTPLEKMTLERMRSAGINIDQVIENVLAQRCDNLAGWWALLIEKEERKEARRERKRLQREAEIKLLRRLSGASGRSRKIGPTLFEADEEGRPSTAEDKPRSSSRGRTHRRSTRMLRPVQGFLSERLTVGSPNISDRPSSTSRGKCCSFSTFNDSSAAS
jgi:hypothetical protein